MKIIEAAEVPLVKRLTGRLDEKETRPNQAELFSLLVQYQTTHKHCIFRQGLNTSSRVIIGCKKR